MAHIHLLGLSEAKSADGRLWKFPYAFPIIIRQLMKTRHTFDHRDTHLDRLDHQELLGRLAGCQGRIFGISAWSHNYHQVKDIAEFIRNRNKDAVIVVGGILSGNADVLLKATEVDVVATGPEGEYILPEILDALDDGGSSLPEVRGISFKDRSRGTIVRTGERPVMDLKAYQAQERPAYEYFDDQLREIAHNINERRDIPVPGFPLLTMRGCPFRCTFCGHLYKRRFLRKNWGLFFDETEFLTTRYGVRGFFSFDTNMFLNPTDVDAYCRTYRNRGASFTICAEMRSTFGDREMFERLREHGVKVVVFGFESGDQRILDRMKKGFHLPDAKKVVKSAFDSEMIVSGNFVFGTPGENKETITNTRNYMLEIEGWISEQNRILTSKGQVATSNYGWSILLPSPASELYEQALAKGLISDEEEYLESLSGKKYKKLLKGSAFKIALVQMAGRVNMSEFPSTESLRHYLLFSLHLVKLKAGLRHSEGWRDRWKAVLTNLKPMVTNWAWYCLTSVMAGLRKKATKRALGPISYQKEIGTQQR